MPIAQPTDEPRRGDPARRPSGLPVPPPSSPAALPRRPRDLVAWVALGLAVTTVLTLVARASLDPRPDRGARAPASARALPAATPDSTALLPTKDRARPDAPTGTTTTVAATPAVRLRQSVATTSTTIPAPADPGESSPTTSTATPPPSGPDTSDRVASDPTGTTGSPAASTGFSGVLRYPEDVATSFPFNSPSGLAAVRAQWQGGEALEMTLGCGQAVTTGGGTHGISLVVAGRPGPCTISIAFGSGEHETVGYTLDIQVPPADSAAPTT